MKQNPRYIEAPSFVQFIGTSIFLAGGITNCENWQQKVSETLLKETSLFILNPRRANFDRTKKEESESQIRWEHFYLNRADKVFFWFPKTAISPIAFFELGVALSRGKKIYLGFEEGHERATDLKIQTYLEMGKEVEIQNSLDKLIELVLRNK